MFDSLIDKVCSRFSQKNISDCDFFVLLIPNRPINKAIFKIKKHFSKIVSLPIQKDYSAHLTLLWGIKFDAPIDLKNFLRHLFRVSKEQKTIKFNHYFVSRLEDRVIFDFSDVDNLFELRSKLLRKSYLFSDVLSLSFLKFNYNRNKDDTDEWYFHPHITILDLSEFNSPFFYYNKELALKEALVSSKRLAKTYVSKFEFVKTAFVYNDKKDPSWKKLISFDLL